MKLNVKLFSQADPRWATAKLGNSTVATIKSDGCVITDVAMLLTYYGKDTDPAKLNIDLIRVKGFSGANIIWGAITDIYPDITVDWDNFINCQDIPAPLSKIDAILASRRPVIVEVDYDTKTKKIDNHWITIIGKADDGAYICNDPIDGTEIFFNARYGDPERYIFRIVAYNGPTPSGKTDADTIRDLQDKVKSQNEQIAREVLENSTLRTDLSTQEADNKDLTDQLNTARADLEKAKFDKTQLQLTVDDREKTIKNLEGNIADRDTTITGLKNDLAAVKKASVSDLGFWELIGLAFSRR